MAEQRLRYTDLAPDGISAMRGVEHYLNVESQLETTLLEFVRLRASLLNGCDYCVGMHSGELHKHNETAERIAGVGAWQHTRDLYTEREQAALAWTEVVTNIQAGHASDKAYAAVRQHFTDLEAVNLTIAIASINTWNRMAIAFRAQKSHRSEPNTDDDGGKVEVED